MTRPGGWWSPRICERRGSPPGPSSAAASSASSSRRLRSEHAHFAVILGDELVKGEVGLRDLPAGTQKLIAIGDLAREIERAQGAHRHGTGHD